MKEWRFCRSKLLGIGLFAGVVLLSACVSKVVPPELRYKVNRSIDFVELLRDPDRYQGELVVLGGVILSSKNLSDGTEIVILHKPLSRTDEPKDVEEFAGRFIAFFPGYLETEVYSKERRITVLGNVNGKVERPIGEMVYTYPLITIRKVHLWPKVEEYPYPYSPYWHDPFYYPYGWWYGPPYRYPYYP